MEKLLEAIETNGAAGELEPTWPVPRKLDNVLRPVEDLDPEVLPGVLRHWIVPAARAIGCPVDFLALAAIVLFGSIIGGRLRLRPIAASNWFVVPNLYAGIVGLPSSRKTPALDEARKPILTLKSEAKEAFDRAMASFDLAQKFYERESARALKEAKDAEAFKTRMALLEQPARPVYRRFEINDVTAPKLVQILAESNTGLVLSRDELAGWLRALEADYDRSARALFLELHPGAVTYEMARVDGRDIFLRSGTLSILGGIQPSKLERYVAEAYSTDNADGLLQRFLFAYPDAPDRRKPVGADFDQARHGLEQAQRMFREIAGVEFKGAIVGENGDRFAAVTFDAEAQMLADEWREDLEAEAGRFEVSDEPWAAYLLKFPKSAFAICLIFHVLEHGARADRFEISTGTAAQGLLFSDYLRTHARRVFGLGENRIFALAAALVGKIRAGELASGFTRHQVARKQWAGLRDRETVGDVLQLLVEYGYLRPQPTTFGRPTVAFEINPLIQPEAIDDAA